MQDGAGDSFIIQPFRYSSDSDTDIYLWSLSLTLPRRGPGGLGGACGILPLDPSDIRHTHTPIHIPSEVACVHIQTRLSKEYPA